MLFPIVHLFAIFDIYIYLLLPITYHILELILEIQIMIIYNLWTEKD